MRRGCISAGEIQCDGCHKVIPTASRYMMVEEEKGKESDKGQTQHYCLDCCRKKGYIRERVEKGDTIETFFPGDENPA